jgi:hypothetical protein
MMLFQFPAQVNERAARLVAAAVAGSVLAGWLSGHIWVLPVLAIGFVLRVGWGPRFSPLARLAMAVSRRLWEIRPVAGPPKRFAQGVGALFTLTATVLAGAGHASVAWTVAGVVAIFATLEATVAICVGCWVYARLQAAGLFASEACVNCARGGRSHTHA